MNTTAMRTGAVLLLSFLASSCASHSFDRLMLDWHGKTLASLLNTWGPPRFGFADREGGYVIVYIPDVAMPAVSLTPALTDAAQVAARLYRREEIHTRPVYAPTLASGWKVFRIFFVDTNGTVIRTEWKGEWACCGT